MNGTPSLLREWDEGSKLKRKELLEWLLGRFQHTHNSGELELECGSHVSLLLPRIIAWMDKDNQYVNKHRHSSHAKTQPRVEPLDEQLGVLFMFLASSSAHVYLHDFLEADGLRVLIKTLECRHRINDKHRCMSFALLLRIIQRGRKFKERISQCDGELVLVRSAIASYPTTASSQRGVQSSVWSLCRMTLLELMHDNHNYTDATHRTIEFMLAYESVSVNVVGAQILRELVNETSFFYDAYYRSEMQRKVVEMSLRLVKSSDVPLHHEGLELVYHLLHDDELKGSLCASLATWIHDTALVIEPVDEAYALLASTIQYEMYRHLRSAFVCSTQTILTLFNSLPIIASVLVQDYEVLIPMAFVLTVDRPGSLKWHAALTAIHSILHQCRDVAIGHLSQLFHLPCEQLQDLPMYTTSDHLADVLLGDDAHLQSIALQFFRNGWVRQLPHKCIGTVDTDDVDPELVEIEYAVHAAVSPVIPTLYPPPAGENPGNDNLDPYTDDMSFAMEQELQQKLKRHFSKFHRLPASQKE